METQRGTGTGTSPQGPQNSHNPQGNIQAEVTVKRNRIHQMLEEQGLDAILISRHENIAWISAGLVDIRVGLLRETGMASLLITKDDRAYYLTTNNEAGRCEEEEFSRLDYRPVVRPWYDGDVQASIRSVVADGLVGSDTPLGACPLLSLQALRFELTDREMERYRLLGSQVAGVASSVLRQLRPGISERDVQATLAGELISAGLLPSVYLDAFDGRIRGFRHAVPRAAVLERFGMVGFCARRWGLSASITRFVHFGPMPAELADKFAVVAEVSARLQAATREGTSAGALFEVAREAYQALGFNGEEEAHHQGGATGYLEREWVARPGGSEQVRPAQAFAWNPNLQGAKVEDTVLLRGGQIELLTRTPDLPAVTTHVTGTDYVSAGVLISS